MFVGKPLPLKIIKPLKIRGKAQHNLKTTHKKASSSTLSGPPHNLITYAHFHNYWSPNIHTPLPTHYPFRLNVMMPVVIELRHESDVIFQYLQTYTQQIIYSSLVQPFPFHMEQLSIQSGLFIQILYVFRDQNYLTNPFHHEDNGACFQHKFQHVHTHLRRDSARSTLQLSITFEIFITQQVQFPKH